MPVAMSIQWKPLRDSHYIVASLQPASGGRRQIFARQSALREIQALAHGDPEHPVIGLLLGERLDCALTGMPYLIVESHAEVALPSFDEQAMSDAIRTLRGRVGKSRSAGEVLGWYCIGPSVDAHVWPIHMAVHAACFAEPWQTVLILGADGDTGAFFLPDASAARWFHAPFSELTNSKAGSQAPKPTTVAWPAYLTTARVVPLAETPRVAPSPPTPRVQTPAQTWMATTGSPPSHQHPVAPLAHQDPVSVPAREHPAASAWPSVAVAPRRPALDLARIFGPIVAAWRNTTEKIVRIRSERAARAEQRKAHADAARAREEERRAKDAAERRAAREAAQRRAAEAAKQRAAEAERRRAAEAEARRAAEAEARLKAAAEAERRRVAEDEARRKAAEEAEQRRVAEEEERRQAAEAEAQRQLEEAEARRAAEAEAHRKAAEEAALRAAEMQARREAAERAQREAEAEVQRRAAEAEAEEQRRAAEAAAQREAAEAEARRLAAQAEAQRLAEEEAEARRQAAEAEAAAQQKAAEAEEEARRNAAAAEEEARRHAAEAEALRISVEVAALRERLARAPVEGSIREVSKVPTVQRGDLDDTAASDEPARYLSLARREGFEVSEEIERGSPEYPETFWLLYEREYGLRLIVVTTDEEVREASLHYNLRTDDDALLRSTPPEHRDLASRTIYGRETCLDKLRARCRRLRATGALQRDWKVSPALRHPDRASNGRAQSFSRAQDSLESTPPAPPLGG
jgi:hypothetical protein